MRKLAKKLDWKTILLGVCTIGWMGVIFALSAQPDKGSADLSGKIAQALKDIVYWIFSGNPPDFLVNLLSAKSVFVRKLGHVTEFGILGSLMTAFLHRLGVIRYLALSALFCSIYAASDEFHQMFVPGRGPAVTDVLIDICGALIGILILALLIRRKPPKVSLR